MLNTFPQLLSLGFFAPTILRIAAALMLLYVAYRLGHGGMQKIPLPWIGHTPKWAAQVASIVTYLAGAALFFGYHTQLAALLGIAIAVKHALLARKHATLLPLAQSTYILLAVICFSLLLTGAGAIAFDLPL